MPVGGFEQSTKLAVGVRFPQKNTTLDEPRSRVMAAVEIDFVASGLRVCDAPGNPTLVRPDNDGAKVTGKKIEDFTVADQWWVN